MAHSPVRPDSPLAAPPPEAWSSLLALRAAAARPLEKFLGIQAASGILLLIAAAVALAWANSPWAASYASFWNAPLGLSLAGHTFERSLQWWVNDVLMVIFFFVVGLEIRREIYKGELSTPRRAALPFAAALGGMLAPAAIYVALAGGPDTLSGWGVPMATDIAFAVGILALLGDRVPPALRVLLLALAVIDDLGAILVIAVFYSSGVKLAALAVALGGILLVLAMQRTGVRSKLAYVVPGIILWAGIYKAGIHPTVAGVILGFLTPMRAWLGAETFAAALRAEVDAVLRTPGGEPSSHELHASIVQMGALQREAMSPAEALIERLHMWVAFGIMPVFALANAGVSVAGGSLDPTQWTVVVGVVAGLVIGKPAGVLAACFVMLRTGFATLPAGIGFRQLLVMGVVAGVGFTMALFIGSLAFTNPALLDAAKLGILGASAIAAVLGLVLGRLLLTPPTAPGVARSADEAEASTVA